MLFPGYVPATYHKNNIVTLLVTSMLYYRNITCLLIIYRVNYCCGCVLRNGVVRRREKWSPGKWSRKMVPGKNGLRKNGPREKWSPGKMVSGKMVPGKIVPGKIVPGKNGPRKNVLQKLFSVKRMVGNLNDFFIFIDSFHCTHTKRCLTFTSRSCKCTKLSNSKRVQAGF